MTGIEKAVKQLGFSPLIAQTARIADTQFGKYCEVGERTVITESQINDYAYVMHDCHIIYSTLGKFCSLANQVRLNPGQHPIEHAALHHFTYRSRMFDMGDDDREFFEGRRALRVTLKEDVWIGHGAIIMPGITIGTGAIVGAGSVVTRDVPDFTVVAGSPAKKLRERFPANIQKALLSIQWWNWPKSELTKALPDFRALSAAAFVKKYG